MGGGEGEVVQVGEGDDRQTDRDRDGGARDVERQRWERDVGREKQGETEMKGDRDRGDRVRGET